MCKKIGVKVINSRASSSSKSGKSRAKPSKFCTLRDKIRYDLLRAGRDKLGKNWVKALPEYQSLLNDEVKEELCGKSPFEIYFNRKSNYIQKPNADSDDDSEGDSVLIRQKIWPRISKQGIKDLEARKKVLMKSAYDASSKCSKTLINRALKRNPLPIYKLKERVMIRYPSNIGKRAPKRRVAIAGTIIASLSKYNVNYGNPNTKVVEKEWVEVTDVTSLTHKKESQRKKLNNVDDFLNAAERENRLESLFAELTCEE